MSPTNIAVTVLTCLAACLGACSSASCSSEYKDAASRTILADIVFEGQPQVPRSLPKVNYNVTFNVKQVLKGSLEKNTKGKYLPVSVGTFGEREIADECVAGPLKSGTKYLVFLRNTSESGSTGPGTHHLVSSAPVPGTKQNVKDAQSHACANCGKLPTVKLTPNKEMKIRIGQKAVVTCTPQGKPIPKITWFKDNQSLSANNRIQLTVTKKSSKIVIKKTVAGHSGFYECQAANVVGMSSKIGVKITIVEVVNKPTTPVMSVPSTSSNPTSSHTIPCPRQDYCFNDGTCLILAGLGQRFCKCPPGFHGNRCEEKRSPFGRVETEPRDIQHEHKVAFFVITIGSSAGILLVAACFICLCAVFGAQITEIRQRKEIRRNAVHYHCLPSPTDVSPRQNRSNQVNNSKKNTSIQTDSISDSHSPVDRQRYIASTSNGIVPRSINFHTPQNSPIAETSLSVGRARAGHQSRTPNTSSSGASQSDAESGEYVVQPLISRKGAVRNDGAGLEGSSPAHDIPLRSWDLWGRQRTSTPRQGSNTMGMRSLRPVYSPLLADETTAL